jgi:hypothetical protein
MPTRKWPVTVVAVVLLGLATSVSAVNLSRYRVTATSTMFSTTQDLDLAKMREACRDKDGCWVTMRFDIHPDSGPASFWVKTARLFLAPDNLLWATDEASGRDADGNSDVVLELGSASLWCVLGDGFAAADAEAGFSLYAIYTGGTAECVVTLID